MRVQLSFLVAALATVSTHAAAQKGRIATFVSVQGKDTTDIEQYRYVGDTIVGVWVERGTDIAVHNYWVALGSDGLPKRYAVTVTHPYGDRPPVSLNQLTIFRGDTATVLDSVPAVRSQRVAIRGGASPPINFMLRFELGLMHLRAAGAKSGTIISINANRMVAGPNGMTLGPAAPESLFASFPSADSAIIGPARMSVDRDGHLLGVRFPDGQEVHRGATADMAKVIAGFAAAAASADSARTIALPPAALNKFVGEYVGKTLKVAIRRNGDKLFMTVNTQPPFPMSPDSPTKFFVRGRSVWMEFETDAAGDAIALIIHQGATDSRLLRAKVDPAI